MKKVTVYLLLSLLLSTSAWSEIPEPTIKLSVENVWQRQQLIISVTVETDDPFAKLRIDDFKQEGLVIIPLTKETIEINRNGMPHYSLSEKWAVFPFIAGEHQIHLPRIRYHPNSGSLKTLIIPDFPLKVRQLPLYVPPTMPVGQVTLQSDWGEGLLINTKSLVHWQLMVTGLGIARQTLPSISRQVSTTDSYDVFPAQYKTEVIETEEGIAHQQILTIPLKATQSGRLQLPVITIQYFNPVLGKLQIEQLKPPFVIALNKWLIGFIGLIGLALSISLVLLLSYKIKNGLRKRARYHQVLSQLEKAETYPQIRDALNQFAIIQGWRSNLTLSEFEALWRQDKSTSIGLETDINKLLKHQFARENKAELKLIAQSLWSKIKAKE